MNRAASSVGLNIAEGCGKSTDRALDYHLDIAVGSIFEVVAASYIAQDHSYISEAERLTIYGAAERLAKSINAFRRTLHPTPISHPLFAIRRREVVHVPANRHRRSAQRRQVHPL
jgi:four helix bundle protein